MTTKLQRYYTHGGLRTTSDAAHLNTVCLDAHVSALEAECDEKDEVISNQEGELVIYRKKLADVEAEHERLRRKFSAVKLIEHRIKKLADVKAEHERLREALQRFVRFGDTPENVGIAIAILKREQKEKTLLELVNQQAEDEGLWFDATTAPEAYLQQELRKLHVAIEGKSIGEAILNREQEKQTWTIASG